jgi:hypothetical protein
MASFRRYARNFSRQAIRQAGMELLPGDIMLLPEARQKESGH